MAKMDELNVALDALNQWALTSEAAQGVSSRFVFGSAINRDGRQFDPLTSDIDLVYLLAADDDALVRVELLRALQAEVSALELILFRALKREKGAIPIVSNCVLTPTEARYDVHKDGKKMLLSSPRFARLPISRGALVSISPAQDPEFQEVNIEVLTAMAYAQGVRNAFLATAPNGVRMIEAIPFVPGEDPLPKALMRTAAMVAWIAAGSSDVTEREDTQRGLDFLSEVVIPKRVDEPEVSILRDTVSVRRSSRGTPEPISPDQQLLLAELLFDAAVEHVRPTIREKLRSYASERLGRNQTQADPRT